jgi:hypothetical protein
MRIKETFMEDIELHPSFIEREGKREYAVLPYEEFEKFSRSWKMRETFSVSDEPKQKMMVNIYL